MIFYWVLITYAFVNVSEEVRFVDYMIEVDIATQLMERAWEREKSFVTSLKQIIRGNQYEFVPLCYMLSSPDYVNTDDITEDAIEAQTILQTQICNSLDFQKPFSRPDHLTDIRAHGKARREIITAATKILFQTDLPCGPGGYYSNIHTCYLIAMALQRQYIFPNCINRVEISGETCYFYDVYERMREFYRDTREYYELFSGNRPARLLLQLAERPKYTILNPENP